MSNWLFLQSAIRKPWQMGSMLPSSRSLARAMVDLADIGEGHQVVELGAGNGSFTRELVERHPDLPLLAFELCPRLGADLARRFPSVRVVIDAAEHLPRRAPSLGLTRIDRVVSGLPWALWDEQRQAAVVATLIPFLSPEARLVTVHYLPSRWIGWVQTTRRVLERHFDRVYHGSPVWRNFPPAYVHVAERPRLRSGAADRMRIGVDDGGTATPA
ncbi:MAG: methyltransferase [Verrucomicrobiae bacterium]|nr:methyltransferase [Verrucomicrobiae bacterium]